MLRAVIADTIKSGLLPPLHIALLLAVGAPVAVLASEAAVLSLRRLLTLLPHGGLAGLGGLL